jgi:large subunit ribosomal protein L4e
MKSAMLYGMNGEEKGTVRIARAFSGAVREDLIRRAFTFETSRTRQPYGPDSLAGKRTSAHYHGRRSNRYSMMNRELARMQRVHASGHLHMTARIVPQATKGIKAHPPKPGKVWKLGMNRKEYRKALLSAAAATALKDVVAARGHRIGNLGVPILVQDGVEGLSKARELRKLLQGMGLSAELDRAKARKVRAGKGTSRGRKYRRKKGPLIVISRDGPLVAAGRNLAGVDVVPVKELTVGLLAPGAHPGRLTVWTQSAVEELEKMER